MKGRKGRAHGAHAELAGGRLEGSRRNDAHAQNHLVQHFCECSATESELRIWEALRKPAPWEGSEGTKARNCRGAIGVFSPHDWRQEGGSARSRCAAISHGPSTRARPGRSAGKWTTRSGTTISVKLDIDFRFTHTHDNAVYKIHSADWPAGVALPDVEST